ncbi:MAG: PIN domain-containing protein [Planctomycetota bacterium]
MDTCVWVSAVRSRSGASFAILKRIGSGEFRFGISVALFLQYRAKLTEARAERATTLSQKRIDAILAALAHYGDPVPIFFRLRPNLADEGDNLVFECAANFAAPCIVTHKVRDFSTPELAGYRIEPVRPGKFLAMLRRDRL